jgi:hypothetical protein
MMLTIRVVRSTMDWWIVLNFMHLPLEDHIFKVLRLQQSQRLDVIGIMFMEHR